MEISLYAAVIEKHLLQSFTSEYQENREEMFGGLGCLESLIKDMPPIFNFEH